MAYMQKTSSDVEKQLYIDKIKELEDKLRSLEDDKKMYWKGKQTQKPASCMLFRILDHLERISIKLE